MGTRSYLRTVRRTALARRCAGLLVLLVLCPFTAPFPTCFLTAHPIGELLAQDNGAADSACHKDVATSAGKMAPLVCMEAAGPATSIDPAVALDLLHQHVSVLRL